MPAAGSCAENDISAGAVATPSSVEQGGEPRRGALIEDHEADVDAVSKAAERDVDGVGVAAEAVRRLRTA